MVDAPKPSDISSVFGLNNPQHIYTKLVVEINHFMDAQSVWTKNEPYPEALFIGFNVAVTAWHMTDWLWMSNITNRRLLAKLYNIIHNETPSGVESGLQRFQNAVAADCRALYICREIALGAKHMRKKKPDPLIKALAEWHPAVQAGGHAKVGDLVMTLSIFDGPKKWVASRLFIEALGYWEKLMQRRKLFTNEGILPQKIIPSRA